jgi:hypothetical protein
MVNLEHFQRLACCSMHQNYCIVPLLYLAKNFVFFAFDYEENFAWHFGH